MNPSSSALLIYDGFYNAAGGSDNPFVASTQIGGAGEESMIDDEAARARLRRRLPGSSRARNCSR